MTSLTPFFTGSLSFMWYVEITAWNAFKVGLPRIAFQGRLYFVLLQGSIPRERGREICSRRHTTFPTKPYREVSTGSRGTFPSSIWSYGSTNSIFAKLAKSMNIRLTSQLTKVAVMTNASLWGPWCPCPSFGVNWIIAAFVTGPMSMHSCPGTCNPPGF